jgi:hypothetical protein
MIFFVLRRIADHGIGMKDISRADLCAADDHDMAEQPAAFAQHNVGSHSAKRTDFNVFGDGSAGINEA